MVALALDDGYWGRMANVAFLPAIIIFMLFIVHFGITQIVCALGPVAHMQVLCFFFVFFWYGHVAGNAEILRIAALGVLTEQERRSGHTCLVAGLGLPAPSSFWVDGVVLRTGGGRLV